MPQLEWNSTMVVQFSGNSLIFACYLLTCEKHSPATFSILNYVCGTFSTDNSIPNTNICLIPFLPSNSLGGCHSLDIPINWKMHGISHSLKKSIRKLFRYRKSQLVFVFKLLNKDLMSDICHLQRTFSNVLCL